MTDMNQRQPNYFVATLVRHPNIVENRDGKFRMFFFMVQYINNMHEDLFSEFNNPFNFQSMCTSYAFDSAP